MFQQGMSNVTCFSYQKKITLGKSIGVSTQDRLMSTSFRFEINKGKPDHSSIRMQKAAEVNMPSIIECNYIMRKSLF